MVSFEIVSEATTRETDFDGTRHMAWSEWSENTAPVNHVINPHVLRVEYVSANGSENTHEVKWDDFVEIISGTGLKFPRTIKVQTYARSPQGVAWFDRGWTKVKITGEYVRYR